jgi:hypothetical protein
LLLTKPDPIISKRLLEHHQRGGVGKTTVLWQPATVLCKAAKLLSLTSISSILGWFVSNSPTGWRQMARKKTPPRGTIRTREHVIADMAVLHVQSLVVRCGFTAQRSESDYGYDLALQTYNDRGEIENETLMKVDDQVR